MTLGVHQSPKYRHFLFFLQRNQERHRVPDKSGTNYQLLFLPRNLPEVTSETQGSLPRSGWEDSMGENSLVILFLACLHIFPLVLLYITLTEIWRNFISAKHLKNLLQKKKISTTTILHLLQINATAIVVPL